MGLHHTLMCVSVSMASLDVSTWTKALSSEVLLRSMAQNLRRKPEEVWMFWGGTWHRLDPSFIFKDSGPE